MTVEIHDNLNADEYNKLRAEAGWEIKNPLIVAKAIRNSTIIKKATCDNEIAGMARAIGDGMSYLLVDVVVSSRYQLKVWRSFMRVVDLRQYHLDTMVKE